VLVVRTVSRMATVLRVDLRMLRLARLHRLPIRRMVILVVSMPGRVMIGSLTLAARLMYVILHVALALPGLGTALPILPHGLYTDSAVIVSSTSPPPTA
jgi:hypothetical protein